MRVTSLPPYVVGFDAVGARPVVRTIAGVALVLGECRATTVGSQAEPINPPGSTESWQVTVMLLLAAKCRRVMA
jgi:hypothetical protein